MTSEKSWKISLYEEGQQAASVHKWIESEKQGCDLGNEALLEWYRNYWYGHCRRGRIEHLRGDQFFEEFEEEQHGRLEVMLMDGDLLLELILDRLLIGWENLCVINWAYDWGMPIERVLDILGMLDINGARLDPNVA